ncbi:hypothetical protein C7450_111189 [Chelatococcus asaccharovorans]|uniref:Uncharacterized protein n=1 Tax=Chelatococcus asaccharovorans TaxID=28210 RepID=A0A2V3TZS9_9HYPH|nr:hypothetical protein C7450_111189 [Chelatococcus asaccharovorans]
MLLNLIHGVFQLGIIPIAASGPFKYKAILRPGTNGYLDFSRGALYPGYICVNPLWAPVWMWTLYINTFNRFVYSSVRCRC